MAFLLGPFWQRAVVSVRCIYVPLHYPVQCQVYVYLGTYPLCLT